jgi:hypothetical protein
MSAENPKQGMITPSTFMHQSNLFKKKEKKRNNGYSRYPHY